METARAFWQVDDLLAEIVGRIVNDGQAASEVIDALANGGALRLRPEDQWMVLRKGLIDMANDRLGMRGVRSGRVQSVSVLRSPLPEESAGLEAYADRVLARLVFQAADGSMKCVTEFTHEDAEAAYQRRVASVRDQADREEPFWTELMGITSNGWTLARRAAEVRRRVARLAVAAELTEDRE